MKSHVPVRTFQYLKSLMERQTIHIQITICTKKIKLMSNNSEREKEKVTVQKTEGEKTREWLTVCLTHAEHSEIKNTKSMIIKTNIATSFRILNFWGNNRQTPSLDMPDNGLRSLTQRTAEKSQKEHGEETGSSRSWSKKPANEKVRSREEGMCLSAFVWGREAWVERTLTESRHRITGTHLRVIKLAVMYKFRYLLINARQHVWQVTKSLNELLSKSQNLKHHSCPCGVSYAPNLLNVRVKGEVHPENCHYFVLNQYLFSEEHKEDILRNVHFFHCTLLHHAINKINFVFF